MWFQSFPWLRFLPFTAPEGFEGGGGGDDESYDDEDGDTDSDEGGDDEEERSRRSVTADEDDDGEDSGDEKPKAKPRAKAKAKPAGESADSDEDEDDSDSDEDDDGEDDDEDDGYDEWVRMARETTNSYREREQQELQRQAELEAQQRQLLQMQQQLQQPAQPAYSQEEFDRLLGLEDQPELPPQVQQQLQSNQQQIQQLQQAMEQNMRQQQELQRQAYEHRRLVSARTFLLDRGDDSEVTRLRGDAGAQRLLQVVDQHQRAFGRGLNAQEYEYIARQVEDEMVEALRPVLESLAKTRRFGAMINLRDADDGPDEAERDRPKKRQGGISNRASKPPREKPSAEMTEEERIERAYRKGQEARQRVEKTKSRRAKAKRK